ncbi:DUF3363 domain-containing protein [Rahnella aceris]
MCGRASHANIDARQRAFALLDDSKGFSLVPWKSASELRLGQTTMRVVHGSGVPWEFAQLRTPPVK